MIRKHAFSLVELSIVLVILGLLVGGILAGQSLIRAAELRSVSSESQRYSTAVNTFRDKYFAIPGDFLKAQDFWGQSTACSGASATGTCNGNGDGTLNNAAAGNTTGEMFQFWRQLALAGLVEGTYSGTSGATNGVDSVIGTNAARSKLSGAGWSARNVGNFAGNPVAYAFDYKNLFSFGAQTTGDTTLGVILKPEEAWNIDTKIDDSKPGTGKTLMISSGAAWGSATHCTTSASATDYTGSYNLSNQLVSCALYFPNAF